MNFLPLYLRHRAHTSKLPSILVFTVRILLCVTNIWKGKVSLDITNVVLQSINIQIQFLFSAATCFGPHGTITRLYYARTAPYWWLVCITARSRTKSTARTWGTRSHAHGEYLQSQTAAFSKYMQCLHNFTVVKGWYSCFCSTGSSW
jgi:hypothetical protein